MDNILNITLESRLNKDNANSVYEDITSKISDKTDKLIIDASKLKYISADGLDVIIRLKTRISDIEIINAGMSVCDIFESYGLNSKFVKLDKNYRFVSVANCEVIGHGGHGKMYKINDDTIIKVYLDSSPLETIENERKFARNAFVNGIPTAIAYDVVETEYGYGVVFELLGGKTLGKFISENPDKTEEYGVKFAQLLRKLNTTDADPDLFSNFHEIYLQRLDNAKKFIGEENGEKLKEVINCIPKGNGMIHGDYHPNNVMVDANGDLVLIDMADISLGNGFFDIGGTYLVMKYLSDYFYTHKYLKNITGIDAKTSKKMWNILLREYYNTTDADKLKQYNAKCKVLSNIRIAASLGMNTSRSEQFTKLITFTVKNFIVPKAKKYMEIMKE